uniref:Uncharacterized protein n=1 Tax=Arundo donax TaxID=35708 RepID=A0A0A8YV68_ARUDO
MLDINMASERQVWSLIYCYISIKPSRAIDL